VRLNAAVAGLIARESDVKLSGAAEQGSWRQSSVESRLRVCILVILMGCSGWMHYCEAAEPTASRVAGGGIVGYVGSMTGRLANQIWAKGSLYASRLDHGGKTYVFRLSYSILQRQNDILHAFAIRSHFEQYLCIHLATFSDSEASRCLSDCRRIPPSWRSTLSSTTRSRA